MLVMTHLLISITQSSRHVTMANVLAEFCLLPGDCVPGTDEKALAFLLQAAVAHKGCKN